MERLHPVLLQELLLSKLRGAMVLLMPVAMVATVVALVAQVATVVLVGLLTPLGAQREQGTALLAPHVMRARRPQAFSLAAVLVPVLPLPTLALSAV